MTWHAFQLCACFVQGGQGISDIITIPGLVNVDFADVKAVMCNSGTAMLGVGVATGKNRAEEAALVRFCPRAIIIRKLHDATWHQRSVQSFLWLLHGQAGHAGCVQSSNRQCIVHRQCSYSQYTGQA